MRSRGRTRRFPVGVLVAIAVGGAAGTVARAGLAEALPVRGDRFPWTTLLVNVAGSFVIGVVVVSALQRSAPSRLTRPLLGTGFCGGMTTFSTFAVETDSLVKSGRMGTAVIYAAASVAAGLLAVWAGARLAGVAWRTESV